MLEDAEEDDEDEAGEAEEVAGEVGADAGLATEFDSFFVLLPFSLEELDSYALAFSTKEALSMKRMKRIL